MEKVGSSDGSSMLCKIRRGKHGETCSSSGIRKTKYACIVEADESTRKRRVSHCILSLETSSTGAPQTSSISAEASKCPKIQEADLPIAPSVCQVHGALPAPASSR